MHKDEVVNDDSRLGTVHEGLADIYVQIKFSAEEADNDFSLDRAVTAKRSMYVC